MSSPDRRLLLVHAHPDDESIYTGATMARYAAEGARVTLVTCTLGELGEIIPPSLAYLAAAKEDRPQVLVTYDARGAYGHPDHIQAHRVAWRACELAGPDGPAKLYATAALGSQQCTTEIDAAAHF